MRLRESRLRNKIREVLNEFLFKGILGNPEDPDDQYSILKRALGAGGKDSYDYSSDPGDFGDDLGENDETEEDS